MFCLAAFLSPCKPMPQTEPTIPIASAKRDANRDGIPDLLGQTVTIAGVITSPPVFLHKSRLLANFQDDTGGLALLFSDPLPSRQLLKEGRRLLVTGKVTVYGGACQLQVQTWQEKGQGTVPEPREVLARDLKGELYEGVLVRVVGRLEVTADGFVLSDRTGSVTVQMPRRFFRLPWFRWFFGPFLGKPSVSITGIGWQQDFDPPYTDGYILLPRRPADISLEPLPLSGLILLLLAITATGLAVLLAYGKHRVERHLAIVRRTTEQLERAQKELQIKRELDRATWSGANEEALMQVLADSLRECLSLEFVRVEVPFGGRIHWAMASKRGLEPKKVWDRVKSALAGGDKVGETYAPLRTDRGETILAVPLFGDEQRKGRIVSLFPLSQRPGEGHQILLMELGSHLISCLEQSRLRRQWTEQQKRMEEIFRSIPIGLVFVGSGQKVVLTNPAGEQYLKILGESRALEGRTPLKGPLVRVLREAATSGERSHQIGLEEPEHRAFVVETQPIGREEGPEGWILQIRDVTWEREVRQRMETQERLAALGQMAAGIAHDFNNLLQSLIASGELLLMEASPEMPEWATDQLRSIQRQAERTARTIRQLLDFGRQTVSRRQRLDLGALVDDIVRLLRRTMPENIEIRWKRGEKPLVVYADFSQMEQVLTNLLINARDAMPEGGTITISLSEVTFGPGQRPPFSEMGGGPWAVLTVEDSGTGIPPDILPRIFEPFFTTKVPGRGTGLGLAQVYGIIRQHEGFIDVVSRVGEFTRFLIYLPALAEPPEALEKVVKEAPQGKGETILLVEDEIRVLESLELLLTKLGYRVETAGNGMEALNYLDRGGKADLILTDMVMPQVGGLRLVKELRKRQFAGKVIVMSGYPLDEALDRLRQSGVSDWIAKPFRYDDLASLIRKVLDELEKEENGGGGGN